MASAVGDQIVLESSNQKEYDTPFVRNSIWEFVMDENGSGVYSSGLSTINTSAFANSSKYINYATAYLSIPVRIRMTGQTFNTGTATEASATVGTFSAGLKNGYYHLIDSCEVSINGVEIQQATSYSNLLWNFRLMTSLSYDDLQRLGSELGFWPDSSTNWSYRAAAGTVAGAGLYNNVDASSLTLASDTAAAYAVFSNNGFLKRQTWLSYTVSGTSGHVNAASAASLAMYFKNYVEYTASVDSDSGAATAGTPGQCIWNAMAIVRLRDICPLFGQMSLSKGLLIRLVMQLNQSTFTIATTPDDDVATTAMTSGAVTLPYGGNTNCVMVASALTGGQNGGLPLRARGSAFPTDLRIGTTPFSSALLNGSTDNVGPFNGQGAIRLWANTVVISPEQERQLIADPIRAYRYNDVYQFNWVVEGQGSTNVTLFNSVPRIRRLIVIPTATLSSLAAGYNGLTTPFDTCPGTTLPCAGLTQCQVMISGVNLMQTPVDYDYRFWLEQVNKTGLYSNQVPGLSSGLIGFEDWSMNQRYYLFNVHNGAESEDSVGKDVRIQFTSESLLEARFFAFIEYERHLTLNILSGAVVEFS